ncbi:hypothetical protein D9611_014766 [Ephemerocybe angulata]|uniref:Uncharacterized protein n=1 Tax=Ephemerocybe angulata TaxID=980116 RepID=A0A8H5F8W2_9AGAR|nr:hypothetical protein D9611_014766 [Tulosesus angulatus]
MGMRVRRSEILSRGGWGKSQEGRNPQREPHRARRSQMNAISWSMEDPRRDVTGMVDNIPQLRHANSSSREQESSQVPTHSFDGKQGRVSAGVVYRGLSKAVHVSNSGAGCAVVEVHLQSQNIRRQPSGPLQHPPTPNPDIHRRPTFVLTLPGPKTPSQTPRRATPSPKHESNQRALCYNMNTKHCRMMLVVGDFGDRTAPMKYGLQNSTTPNDKANRRKHSASSPNSTQNSSHTQERGGCIESTSRDCRALTASRVSGKSRHFEVTYRTSDSKAALERNVVDRGIGSDAGCRVLRPTTRAARTHSGLSRLIATPDLGQLSKSRIQENGKASVMLVVELSG